MAFEGKTQTIIITGVAGFLGRYAARYFHQNGWKVIGVDVLPPENVPKENLFHYERMLLPGSNFNNLLISFEPFACIHAAGRAAVRESISDPSSDFYSGPNVVFEILNSINKFAPECKFIFLSSAAIYGNPQKLPIDESQPPSPLSPYGFHKWQSELVCQEFSKIYNLNTTIVRIFSAYGPGLRRQVIWDICQKALNQSQLILQGTGSESRDFIHAYDIASALEVLVLNAPLKGEVFNLASGSQVLISELANLILEQLRLDLVPIFDNYVPEGVPLNWEADISRLSNLGYKPSIVFSEGVKLFVNWCKAELHPEKNNE